jgi:Family of unknown function (DUF6283)
VPDQLPRRRYPCAECPFRRDTPPGQFTARRYEALAETAGSDERPVMPGSPIFACHKSHEGHDEACAGWLAVCGHDHLSIRLAVITGRLEMSDIGPAEGWPELFGSYAEMAAAQGGDDG